MKTSKRRVFTAPMLLILFATLFQQPAFALTPEAHQSLHAMWGYIGQWYDLFLAIVIPLFIIRLACYGIKIVYTVFLSKWEFAMDDIKKDILSTLLAVAVLCLLPVLIDVAFELVKGRAWTPPTISYFFPIGGMKL